MSDRDDIEKIQYVIRDLLKRVGILEEQHSLFRKYEIDGGLAKRIDQLEIDIKNSPLFSKESVERAREAIDRRKDEIDEENKNSKVEDQKDSLIKETQDMAKRLKARESTKFEFNPDKKGKVKNDDGNGDVPEF